MMRCASCDGALEAGNTACPACGFAPAEVDGFAAFAPQFAHAGGGFNASDFAPLAALEEAHFWFRARNELLMWALDRYCAPFRSYLEIGCGTGYVLQGVSRSFPQAELTGSEIFTAGLQFAGRRIPRARLVQMDARRIPFEAEFDVVGAFDVLEHIAEDDAVLAQVWRALRPGGHLLLTVPQHEWLWSAADEHARHQRRYSRALLHRKVRAAGFDVVRSTSFVSLLLPVMLGSRLFARRKPERYDPTAELRLPALLNRALYAAMQIELALVRTGLDLPAGGSRLLVARKTCPNS